MIASCLYPPFTSQHPAFYCNRKHSFSPSVYFSTYYLLRPKLFSVIYSSLLCIPCIITVMLKVSQMSPGEPFQSGPCVLVTCSHYGFHAILLSDATKYSRLILLLPYQPFFSGFLFPFSIRHQDLSTQ